MSAPNPKEAWAKIQQELTKRGTRFGGAGGGGPPKGLFGGIGGLILVGGGIWVANNALFNGTHHLSGVLQQLLQYQKAPC
jgi:prohibitin 2